MVRFCRRRGVCRVREGAVDGDGRSEVVVFADELGGNIRVVAVLFVLRGVLEAEAGGGVGDEFAAAAFAHAVLTTREFTDGAGVKCFWTFSAAHFDPRLGKQVGMPPRQFS